MLRWARVRTAAAVLTFLAAACIPPVPQPAPAQLESALAPAEAIRAATRALALEGFEVATADTVVGLLTMKRHRAPQGNAEYLRCNWSKDSAHDANGVTTLTLQLVARAREGGGSAAVLTSRVLVSFPSFQGSVLATPDTEEWCASNGKAEAAVATALGVR